MPPHHRKQQKFFFLAKPTKQTTPPMSNAVVASNSSKFRSAGLTCLVVTTAVGNPNSFSNTLNSDTNKIPDNNNDLDNDDAHFTVNYNKKLYDSNGCKMKPQNATLIGDAHTSHQSTVRSPVTTEKREELKQQLSDIQKRLEAIGDRLSSSSTTGVATNHTNRFGNRNPLGVKRKDGDSYQRFRTILPNNGQVGKNLGELSRERFGRGDWKTGSGLKWASGGDGRWTLTQSTVPAESEYQQPTHSLATVGQTVKAKPSPHVLQCKILDSVNVNTDTIISHSIKHNNDIRNGTITNLSTVITNLEDNQSNSETPVSDAHTTHQNTVNFNSDSNTIPDNDATHFPVHYNKELYDSNDAHTTHQSTVNLNSDSNKIPDNNDDAHTTHQSTVKSILIVDPAKKQKHGAKRVTWNETTKVKEFVEGGSRIPLRVNRARESTTSQDKKPWSSTNKITVGGDRTRKPSRIPRLIRESGSAGANTAEPNESARANTVKPNESARTNTVKPKSESTFGHKQPRWKF